MPSCLRAFCYLLVGSEAQSDRRATGDRVKMLNIKAEALNDSHYRWIFLRWQHSGSSGLRRMGRKRVREDEMNKERERDVKPLQRNASYLWSSLWQTQAERLLFFLCCPSLSAFFLSLCSILHIPPPFQIVPHSTAHPPVPLLLTHTKSKLHRCGSIQSMSVHVSAHPTLV